MKQSLRRVAASLVAGCCAPTALSAPAVDIGDGVAASRPASARAIQGAGWLDLDFNPDALRQLGLRVDKVVRGHRRVPVLPEQQPLTVFLADGAPTGIGKGALWSDGLRFQREDGSLSPPLRLMAGGDGLDLSLRAADGGEWARIEQVMRSPDVAADGFRYVTANLAAGAALSAFAGHAHRRVLLGNVSLQLPLEGTGIAKSEADPIWPGTAGTITDVLLTDIPDIAISRCRVLGGGAPCDGPGGSEGEVVVTPSARLRNSQHANSTDVPWYRMFSEATSRYPDVGPKIDQHPYLLWNLYRFDSDGRITQIARSGLKHAFATGNEMCSGYTPYGHILGPACSDLYNLTSNDCDRFLGPRSEIIPATGQWGRCGSIQDPDCNGATEPPIPDYFSCAAAQGSPASDKYSYRLLARETDIDPDLHPDARWFMDAWYVIRDDENIENSMGFRELTLGWQSTFSRWTVTAIGPYEQGAVIDQWLAQADAGETTFRSQRRTPEGELGIAVRIRQLVGGDYQYDYAIMNFDFARAETDPLTAEPNLRVLSNLGLSSLALSLKNGAMVDSSEFLDGDATAANDWLGAASPTAWQWLAPDNSATLDWGQLRFLRVVSAAAPGPRGSFALGVADSGVPDQYTVILPAPDGAAVFWGGFE